MSDTIDEQSLRNAHRLEENLATFIDARLSTETAAALREAIASLSNLQAQISRSQPQGNNDNIS